MNRLPSFAFSVALAALILCFGESRMHAQEPAAPPPAQTSATPPPSQEAADADKDGKDKDGKDKDGKDKDGKDKDEEENNPFAPEPAKSLPPGMTGSDTNDPRAKLTPGLYDAGETSMGIKHLTLLNKPDAFQLGASDPDDPKVQKMIGRLGMSNISKLPKPMHLVIAE